MNAIATSPGVDLLAVLRDGSVAREPEPVAARRVSAPTPAPAPASRTFEAIYRDHYRDVYRYVVLNLRRPNEADDIVADTFDRAFSAWRSGHGPAGRALPWLLVIARRIVIDRWRRARLLSWLPLSRPGGGASDHVDADDPAGRAEIWMWLDQLAAALPQRQREVLFLRYQRDLTDDDIGEVLGLSASGVRTLAARALAALRAHPELWS
jgi:RNA polymerase sigma-70 factor (ECF subfamily)